LLSQVLFPFRGHFPINTSLQFPNDLNEFTPLTHLGKFLFKIFLIKII